MRVDGSLAVIAQGSEHWNLKPETLDLILDVHRLFHHRTYFKTFSHYCDGASLKQIPTLTLV